jgi:hypothetical protein
MVSIFRRRGFEESLCGQGRIDAAHDVGGHAGRPRQGAQQAADLFKRRLHVCAQWTVIEVTAHLGRACGREKAFGEVGDFRDVRVPSRVGRCHARPPPPFTAAGSLGPVSLGPDAGGTDVPGVRFLPMVRSVLSPA